MPGDWLSALRRDPALGGLVALWGGVAFAAPTQAIVLSFGSALALAGFLIVPGQRAS